MNAVQTVGFAAHPIGVSDDTSAANVRLAVYSGQILLLPTVSARSARGLSDTTR